MPTTRPRPDETREMRFVSKIIELDTAIAEETVSGPVRRETSLPEFMARRRRPGDDWRTWDELSFELAEITGEIVTDGTLRQWAVRYGIPEDTSKDGKSGLTLAEYQRAIKKARITIS